MENTLPTASGFCHHCRAPHRLPAGDAQCAALELMAQLDSAKRLDFHLPEEEADSRLSTDYLFGEARGKMFGVLVCRSSSGSLVTLKAFSGQYNGAWQIDGWVPPLFDLKQWRRVNDGPEREIKRLGAEIEITGPHSPEGKDLTEVRRERSRQLMKELHRLYRIHNFRNQIGTLAEAFNGGNGIPNGTADCCAPKLLNEAARKGLHPLGLAEFYYGRSNKRGTKRHGRFYSPCREKCAPILGFMLCGLDHSIGEGERRDRNGT